MESRRALLLQFSKGGAIALRWSTEEDGETLARRPVFFSPFDACICSYDYFFLISPLFLLLK